MLLTAIAGIIAFVAALLFVKPLEKMTQGARYLASSPENQLHANIRRLSVQIPDKRKDEVGDIGKAAKMLFKTVNESHRKQLENAKKLERHKGILEEEVARRTIQLRKQNQELEDAAKEKDQFLASVSHELRTPLTVVAGNLQLLQRKKLGESEARYVTKALAGSRRLEALIRDLLDIQKIIMGGMSLEPQRFELPELLDELKDALQPNAEKNHNEFTVSSEGLGTVYGDRGRLSQILSNLVTNACKFTYEGMIKVEANALDVDGGSWMRFEVADTGRGMTPEEQRRIFDRFYTNKKANESGTGLGLDICNRLAALMGGRVYLERSEIGAGSVFVVELPQHMEVPGQTFPEKELATRDSDALYPAKTQSPPTILVIDDEPGIQDLMVNHLAERGYRAIVADSGEKGLELARSEKPDLITLDVMMEGSDGWRVIEQLKTEAATNAIPVVMVTILDRKDKGFALGAADYFTKPIDWERMFRVLV
jgi:signal transduction histidine kinase